MTRPKPVVLIILDGWGVAAPSHGNAITLAKKPNFDGYLANYPAFTVQASGEAVGLSWGEMGNSEVGHLSLGAGFIIYQSLPRITRAISDGSFFTNPALTRACLHANEKGGDLHIMGLVSPGGVHSYNEHLYALVELAKNQRVKNLFVHVFLDGRDTPYNSGIKYVEQLQKKLKQMAYGEIATISGRFYAMDRDNHWERTEKAYRAIALGESEKSYDDPLAAINESYKQSVYDEEFLPVVITKDGKPKGIVKEGDSLIFFNFRADRAREIAKAFVLPGFEKFKRPKYIQDLVFIGMTEYEKDLPIETAFPPQKINTPLAKVISEAGLTQLHIAETEKYAHVTFFFNGGEEVQYPGEERVIIPSPRVASYDQKPEMSAPEVTNKVLQEIAADKFDFIVINYANSDMVGHTGNLNATIAAVEALDELIGRVVNGAVSKGGVVLITADHGNAEEIYKLQTGEIDKEHSSLPVPLLIIGNEFKGKIAQGTIGNDLSQMTPAGVLADVTPTILKIMGLKRPDEMTGRPLI